jgi:peptide/nickel transport system substrate-binding protein
MTCWADRAREIMMKAREHIITYYRHGMGRAAGIAAVAFATLTYSALSSLAEARLQATGAAAAKTQSTGAEPIDLLKGNPFDRITLIDGSVHLIEPVSPRPLPEYDAAKAKEEERAKARATKTSDGPPAEGNIFVGKKSTSIKSQIKEDPSELAIHLLEGEIHDFKIKRTSLRKIEYFEDLLLAEGERLLLAKQFSKAFEHYMAVQARDPNWNGLAEHVDRLLFEEGSWSLLDQDRQRGARLLGDLAKRRPDYPGLSEKLALAYGGRIDEAIGLGRFDVGRQSLHHLETITPGNSLIEVSRAKFTKKATELTDSAKGLQGAERLDALSEALRVWPKLEGVADDYEKAFREWPTLDVGVYDVPRGLSPFARTPAARRAGALVYQPLISGAGDAAGVASSADQVLTAVEVADLGKRLDLTVRPGPSWSDGSRNASGVDVAQALVAWAEPRSPGFLASWADVLERVEVSDDMRVTVLLKRPLVRPATWFTRSLGPAHASFDGRVPGADGRKRPVGTGSFVWQAETDDRLVVARNEPESGDSAGRIRRVRESRFPSGPAAVGALVRGEITLLELVPPDRVGALQSREEIRIGTYTNPSVHVLAIDGRTVELKNRSLRRAIAMAIDRTAFLQDSLLRRAVDERNRPADGPAISASPFDAPGVKPYSASVLLSKMLVAAAKRELGGKPIKLVLEYPARPEAQLAAPFISDALRAAGIEIELLERPETELEGRLRSGARFDLAYRALCYSQPLRELGSALCPGYEAAPASGGLGALETSPRILQLLLQLEQATDPAAASEIAVQIDRESHDELPVVPLWQIEDHYAWRTRLSGPTESAQTLYQGIESWEIQAWFVRDPW